MLLFLFEFDVGHRDVGFPDRPGVLVVFILEKHEGAGTHTVAGKFAAVRGSVDIFHVDLHGGIWKGAHFQQIGSFLVGLDRRKGVGSGIVLPFVTADTVEVDVQILDGVSTLIGDLAFYGIMRGRGAVHHLDDADIIAAAQPQQGKQHGKEAESAGFVVDMCLHCK